MGQAESFSKINPRARQVEVGIRQLYTVNVYPLSIMDEISFLDSIKQSITNMTLTGSEAEFAARLLEEIKENIVTLIHLVIDEDEWKDKFAGQDAPPLLSCIDNDQLMDIAELIYDMNFEEPSKKALRVVSKTRMKDFFGTLVQKKDLSLDSSDTTPNIDFPTALEDDLKTEDLQSNN